MPYILSHNNLLENTRAASDEIIQCCNIQETYERENVVRQIRKELRNKWVPAFWFDQVAEQRNAAYKEIKELKKKLENSAANWQI
jgi:hypothetical protein